MTQTNLSSLSETTAEAKGERALAFPLATGSASDFSSSAQNLVTSATANAAQAVALTGDADAESGDASGECADEDFLSYFRAKQDRGEHTTNTERARRQGIIFNHCGKARGFCVI